mgnify:FL=1
MQRLVISLLLGFLSACSVTQPRHINNVCQIFAEKDDWYEAARASEKRWGIPIAVQMAIMHQESAFIADAEPPAPLILGFIPWFKSSSAYGYAQAQAGTWSDYQKQTGHPFSSRDDFVDSCDFIGWYCSVSHNKLGINNFDAYNLYLSYHEGHGGFLRKTHHHKQWLLTTAQKVAERSQNFANQLKSCRESLDAN